MIKKAVERGVDDILENTERGIRNLVDLGVLFSIGRFQKDFVLSAQRELSNLKSPYYQLIKRVVHGVDKDQLVTFGMNLGYCSWSAGAKKLFSVEKEGGFNIPWVLFFKLTLHGQHLLPDKVKDIIEQGKALGIYSYTFSVYEEYPYLTELIDVLGEEPDCAFCLFLNANLITQKLIDRLAEIKTVFTLIRLEEESNVAKAAAMLLNNKMLCGAYSNYADLALDAMPSLRWAEELGFSFMVFVRDSAYHLAELESENSSIRYQREHLEIPVFPIDFYKDVAHIDRNLCDDACLVSIYGDGSMKFVKMETPEIIDKHSIYDDSLKNIFADVLKK
jgi:hypothetical protein